MKCQVLIVSTYSGISGPSLALHLVAFFYKEYPSRHCLVTVSHNTLLTYLKTVPLQANAGAKGEWKCSSYSFLTSALFRDEWSASRLGRALPQGKESPVPIG
jgi:hypothetical protein